MRSEESLRPREFAIVSVIWQKSLQSLKQNFSCSKPPFTITLHNSLSPSLSLPRIDVIRILIEFQSIIRVQIRLVDILSPAACSLQTLCKPVFLLFVNHAFVRRSDSPGMLHQYLSGQYFVFWIRTLQTLTGVEIYIPDLTAFHFESGIFRFYFCLYEDYQSICSVLLYRVCTSKTYTYTHRWGYGIAFCHPLDGSNNE